MQDIGTNKLNAKIGRTKSRQMEDNKRTVGGVVLNVILSDYPPFRGGRTVNLNEGNDPLGFNDTICEHFWI